MWATCFDCEGVLIPEIWLSIYKETGIDGLQRTTRDEPNYDRLMTSRLELLRINGVKIELLKSVADSLDPLEGALETLALAHEMCHRVFLLTDTFEEYASDLISKLGSFPMLCNSLGISSDGYISTYNIRLLNQKEKAVSALQNLNFKVLAVGDSFNDISMLKKADIGILFRPSDSVRALNPEFRVVESHDELRQIIKDVLKR